MARDAENTLILDLKTGPVVIALKPDVAPNHVARIKERAPTFAIRMEGYTPKELATALGAKGTTRGTAMTMPLNRFNDWSYSTRAVPRVLDSCTTTPSTRWRGWCLSCRGSIAAVYL